MPATGRHRPTRNNSLRAGLETLSLEYIPEHSLTTLNAVHIPEGIDDKTVRGRLLSEYGIEIGAGLGPFAGKAWRIGLMGESSTKHHVMLLLGALETIMSDLGLECADSATAAATAMYQPSVPLTSPS